jgi:hypothetical protein
MRRIPLFFVLIPLGIFLFACGGGGSVSLEVTDCSWREIPGGGMFSGRSLFPFKGLEVNGSVFNHSDVNQPIRARFQNSSGVTSKGARVFSATDIMKYSLAPGERYTVVVQGKCQGLVFSENVSSPLRYLRR